MAKKLSAKGIIGSVQFEGFGPNSGQAQIVISRYTSQEARFLLGVTNATDGSIELMRKALEAMWLAADVEVTYVLTASLPVVIAIGYLPAL